MLRWYVNAASAIFSLCVIGGVAIFAAFQASANIWLSAWTDDASAATVVAENGSMGIEMEVDGNDGVGGSRSQVYLRLGVYAALTVGQG